MSMTPFAYRVQTRRGAEPGTVLYKGSVGEKPPVTVWRSL